MASVCWLQSTGGPYSCSLADLPGLLSLRADNKSLWWLSAFCWPQKIGNCQLHPRIRSAGELYSPGPTDDSTAEVELHLFQLACGLPHNLFVMLSQRQLGTQSQQQPWLEVQSRSLTRAADCSGHQERYDEKVFTMRVMEH